MTGKMLFFFAVASFLAWPLLFAGIGTRRDARRREEREYTRTTGVIVAYVRREIGMERRPKGLASQRPEGLASRRGTVASWRPIVEYTAEGQLYRQEYDGQMDRNRFPEGLNVEVLYDVNAPEHFHLEADPVFIHKGAGAIRFALVWILASAALTIILAVFVGDARPDLDGAQRFFQGRR